MRAASRAASHSFQVPLVAADEAQDEVAGAFLYIAVGPFRRRPGRARETGLTLRSRELCYSLASFSC